MKKDLSLWQLAGFAFTAIGGTLLHFLYDWTGENPVVAAFSGVNESTWEHMKLLFVPLLLFALVQRRFFRDCNAFWSIKLKGIILGLLLIPVLFYTYNGAIGKSPDWINIAIFFLAAASAFLWEFQAFRKTSPREKSSPLPWIPILLMAVLFAVFTYFTPEIGLFRDPLSGSYGIDVKEASLFQQSLFCFFIRK